MSSIFREHSWIFSQLHFGIDENKREYKKKTFANAITRSYQFFCSSQVGVSPSAITVLFWDFIRWIRYQRTREKLREKERNNVVIVRQVCNKPRQFAQSVAMSKSIATISDQAQRRAGIHLPSTSIRVGSKFRDACWKRIDVAGYQQHSQ